MPTLFTRSLAALILLGSSVLAHAGLTLSNNHSSLSLVTTKATNVAEVHHFNTLSGSISDVGEAVLTIDLSSIDTNIAIRDERMRKMLFHTAQYPTAELSAQVSLEHLNDLDAGDNLTLDLKGSLSLHGTNQPVTTKVRVTKLANGGLQVASLQPVLINADNVGLAEGVEELREVAGLDSISHSVAVSFLLTYLPE